MIYNQLRKVDMLEGVKIVQFEKVKDRSGATGMSGGHGHQKFENYFNTIYKYLTF